MIPSAPVPKLNIFPLRKSHKQFVTPPYPLFLLQFHSELHLVQLQRGTQSVHDGRVLRATF